MWRLGEARIGPVMAPVWLARGMDVNVDEVFQSLLDTRLPEQGWFFVTGASCPRDSAAAQLPSCLLARCTGGPRRHHAWTCITWSGC